MPAGDAEQDGTLAREAVVFPTVVHGAAHGAGTADGNKKPRNRGAFFSIGHITRGALLVFVTTTS
jgi:hypothetical protein